MLPRYRLDFTPDAADQMAYGELANDGDAVHLLTIGLVPFAVTQRAATSVVTIRLTTTLATLFFRRVLPLARPFQQRSEAKRKSGGEFLIE